VKRPLNYFLAGVLLAGAFVATGCEGEMTVVADEPVEDPFDTVEPPAPPEPVDHCADVSTATEESPVRLLTRYEYDNTVRDLLGVNAAYARDSFPPENAVDGWENGAESHIANPLLVRRYLEVSQAVTSDYMAAGVPAELTACVEDVDSCVDGYMTDFLTRAFRRPPTAEELEVFRNTVAQAQLDWGTEGAVEVFVASVLNAPQFLYRVTLPAGEAAVGEAVEVSSWDMASRLSYFIWGSMPDDALLDAAAADELRTPEQVEAQTQRMLDDPKSLELVGQFYRQWLKVDKLDTMVKDDSVVEGYDESLAAAWKASLEAYVTDIHANGGTLEDLLTGKHLYLNDRLAPIYGMEATTAEMTRFDMDNSRAGLLTQPGLMAVLAYPDQTSPIHRGIFVREQLLCQHLGVPPDANLQPPELDPNLTTRERFARLTAEPTCTSCHVLIDPLGFGFENYDPVGRYRDVENGQPVDASGRLVATRDPALSGEFDGVAELSQRLANAREVQDCVAQKWVTFAIGGAPAGDNLCAMQRVQERFAEHGGSFRELMVAITTSDAFRFSENPSLTAIPGGSE
jgi:hypothetical protein